jgi:hypothetical protein
LEEEKKILEQLHNFQLKNSEAKQKGNAQNDLPPPLSPPSPPTKTTKKTDLTEYCPKFTPIPKRAAEKGATPQEITLQNLDKSTLLRKLLETYSQGILPYLFIHLFMSSNAFLSTDNKMLLGELQYAFATFLFGHSFEGFRQWKELLIILTNCETAMRTSSQFFCSFIGIPPLQRNGKEKKTGVERREKERE